MHPNKTYQVNFDFEQQLYNPQWKHQKQRWNILNLEWEYLYFYCEELPLQAFRSYSNQFLQGLNKLGIAPVFNVDDKKENVTPWWGQTSNIELEIRLNDKFEALKCAEKLKLNHYSTLVNSQSEISALAQNYSGLCFMRTRYGQAGKNLKLFTNGEALQHYLKTTPFLNGPFNQGLENGEGVLCGAWKKRLLDIGGRYWIDQKREPEHWFSFVDHFGIYRGGLFLNNKKNYSVVCQNFTIDFAALCRDQEFVLKYYTAELGLQDSIQMDAFLTQERLIPFQEANHRRTMGDILCNIQKKYGNSILGMLVFEKRIYLSNELINNRRDFAYSLGSKEGILQLSPQESGYLFDVFFISLSKHEQIAQIKKAFPDFFELQPYAEKLLQLALR